MAFPELDSADDQTFDAVVLGSALPVLVEFWGPTCVPCIAVERLLRELAPSQQGRVRLVRVNAEDAADVAARFGVRGLPHLAAFRDGRLLESRVGAPSKKSLVAWLDSLSSRA